MLTEEQEEWLRANVKGKSVEELCAMINDLWGLELTVEQIRTYKRNHNISSGLSTRFVKGQPSANKGRKMDPKTYERCKPTMFKKGHKTHNWKPVGTERVNADGYREVKIAEPSRWKQLSHIVWEEHNGPIPEGHIIIYADGDSLNCGIENLRCISRGEHSRMNHMKLYNNNPGLTDAGIAVAKIMSKIKELRDKDD